MSVKRAGQQPKVNHDGDIAITARDGAQQQYSTACFNCRAVRQKCDRRMPCRRCCSQQRPCRYPSGSNRGRKLGSTNKPTTVEKLLSRITQSGIKDQLVAAILNETEDSTSQRPDQNDFINTAAEPDEQHSLISPLHVLAAAVTNDLHPPHTSHPRRQARVPSPARGQTTHSASSDVIDERLAKYFAHTVSTQSDWQVLTSQSIDTTFKLELTTCDPIAARLIDQTDSSWYFELFFKMRNPFVGLLDPDLHTVEYVYSASFTLFSVVCALGCAVSPRPRDRLLYPALLHIAEGNLKWSIAASIRCIETIQAIFCMQYWAPICQKQSDDPYWLHLSHGIQLARELGLNRPSTISMLVNAAPLSATSPELRERLQRNFERAWLYTFVADKSFGIIRGRSMCVSWREISSSAAGWWRKSQTMSLDRMISGVVEMRVLLLNALDLRKSVEKTTESTIKWQSEAFDALSRIRNARCKQDGSLSATYSPILAYYMEHGLLVLNVQATRDLLEIDEARTTEQLCAIFEQTVQVATRMLDLVLSSTILRELMYGFHNNMFIQICHAATEIIHAIKQGQLAPAIVNDAVSKVRAIPKHMETIAQGLPTSSAAHLYARLSHVFACQLDRLVGIDAEHTEVVTENADALFADWCRTVEDGSLDATGMVDLDFLTGDNITSPDTAGMDRDWSSSIH